MTLLDRLEILSQVIADDNTARRISQAAAVAVVAEYKQRIFSEGLDSSGNPIANKDGNIYSVNPFYVNPLSLVGVASAGIKPEGKNGQSVFKSGKPHKTKYLTNGYKQLRELTGRQTAVVDLNFSGDLFQSVKAVEVGSISYISYTSATQSLKMSGYEERNNRIISAVTDSEQEIGYRAAQNELLAILEEIDTL
jgi:hypothetical protein